MGSAGGAGGSDASDALKSDEAAAPSSEKARSELRAAAATLEEATAAFKPTCLLGLAAQNLNQKLCEILLARNADINHRNAQGNTPLHFAMAYDSEGTLAEYLIQQGADDTIENALGCTCYDGIGQ